MGEAGGNTKQQPSTQQSPTQLSTTARPGNAAKTRWQLQ